MGDSRIGSVRSPQSTQQHTVSAVDVVTRYTPADIHERLIGTFFWNKIHLQVSGKNSTATRLQANFSVGKTRRRLAAKHRDV
jgi:hypothetical protein